MNIKFLDDFLQRDKHLGISNIITSNKISNMEIMYYNKKIYRVDSQHFQKACSWRM